MRLRIYIDTSVIGGCIDEEFAEASLALLDKARRGELMLLISDLLAEELAEAPPSVQAVYDQLPPETVERLAASAESVRLRDVYVSTGAIGAASTADAHHVALATVARADIVVSWNFRHIVHVDRIRMFNAANLMQGYGLIDIRSPWEVV